MGAPIRLLAFVPSGEACIVERDEQAWLVGPPGTDGPWAVSRAEAERTVSEQGFIWVDRLFDSPAALDAYVEQEAARVTPDVVTRPEAYDEAAVRRLIAIGREWRADGDPRAVRLARTLLDVPVVMSNAELMGEVARLLDAGTATTAVSIGRPLSPLGTRARARLHESPVAA